tara:strand:+ start:245 stop:844 length:600 start_codon:yes stop_codon:yes gene_type:complete
MIQFNNINSERPYQIFKSNYDDALSKGQEYIEAAAISSFSKKSNKVNSRYVNIKFIEKDRFIFFSNYNSPKSNEFDDNNHIAVLFFWSAIGLQIRMQGIVTKTSTKFNKNYFKSRDIRKNALAISSSQSSIIDGYEQVLKNYENAIKSKDLLECPDYWGGFEFCPESFEFWHGREFRLNLREKYQKKSNKNWEKIFLQP